MASKYALVHTFLGCTLALIGVFAFAPAAGAGLIINPIFDASITGDPNAAFIEATINQAINIFETGITTPITVNIEYGETNSGLGQSSTFYGTVTYTNYLAALQAHSSGDAVDVSALSTLPGGPNNPVNGTTSVDVTTANLRALGFNFALPVDSTILVNTAITNYTGGAPFNASFYSLLAVIEHETDEALGTGSDIDTGNLAGDIRGEDLFRYSAPGVRSYTASSSATSYLSVDGGVTDVVDFNQIGGGSDYGDWASSATPRVQDAFGTPGSSPVWGVAEQTALDAIGYNFSSSPVPEPATFWLLAAALAGFFIHGRRKRFVR